MFRKFVLAAALATLPVLSSSTLLGQDAPSAAPGSANNPILIPKMPKIPKPVNLKVLPKDISSEDLMKVMFGFSKQLGVKCTFCHVEDAATKRPNFASDEKPEKNTARTMMSMTQEINGKYLSQIHDPDAAPDQKTVSCGTCHQGHSMPMPFKAPTHPNKEHPGMDHPATPPKP
jgi:hypothetical protein